MAKLKTKDKTLEELKESIDETKLAKQQLKEAAKDEISLKQKQPYGLYIIVVITLMIMILGFLERNRVMGMFGGIAFLFVVGFLIIKLSDI